MSALEPSLLAELDEFVADGAPMGMKASVVVAPSTGADVAKVLVIAAAHGVAVTPFGSGSTRGGTNAEIALSTRNLAGVVDYQPDDLTVVVGAGTRVSDLEELLAVRGHTAVLPENAGERTVGGVVASGASGYRRLKYGPTRDRVLEVELATGYGEVARGGGRLVKNVTGYDLPRLVTGSLGSLGIIASVCLKLWPEPSIRRTVMVDDAAGAIDMLYKPVAILETHAGSCVYLEGHEATVTKQSEVLAGDTVEGFGWPELDAAPVGVSVRVPARSLTEGIGIIGVLDPLSFVAQHGVGIIDVGISQLDLPAIERVRGWAEEVGGSLIVDAAGLTAQQRWGTPPTTVSIQRRMKTLFDPAGVCNPGVLPGGL